MWVVFSVYYCYNEKKNVVNSHFIAIYDSVWENAISLNGLERETEYG